MLSRIGSDRRKEQTRRTHRPGVKAKAALAVFKGEGP
jgi:hypothetical protein